jgi:hypothetical protein
MVGADNIQVNRVGNGSNMLPPNYHILAPGVASHRGALNPDGVDSAALQSSRNDVDGGSERASARSNINDDLEDDAQWDNAHARNDRDMDRDGGEVMDMDMDGSDIPDDVLNQSGDESISSTPDFDMIMDELDDEAQSPATDCPNHMDATQETVGIRQQNEELLDALLADAELWI